MEEQSSVLPPRGPGRRVPLIFAVALVAIAAVVAWVWWPRPASAPPAAPPVAAAAPEPVAPKAPSEPVIKFPLPEAAAPDKPAPAASDTPAARLAALLTEALGRDAVLKFLQLDEFAHRVVATVDNLQRPQAASRLWPVNPTAKRFLVATQGDSQVISPDNELRYTPFVLMVESVDIGRAVNGYVRLYPQLQQAYVQLGYPTQYFNDRLIEVIDHLLATPEPAGPLKVQLTEVKGPVPSTRPWTRYEFADPQFEALSSGQKIMLRIGPVNQRRLKTRLAEIRRQLVALSERKGEPKAAAPAPAGSSGR